MNVSVIFFILIATALAHESGEMAIKVGSDQGVTEVSPEKGFKLHEQARKRFRLKFQNVEAAAEVVLPSEAVVRTLEQIGVYRSREGFIRRIQGQVHDLGSGRISIVSKELATGDQVLVSGVGFVRVIEASFGESISEDKHGDDHEEGHHD